jgi:hypothetical protein
VRCRAPNGLLAQAASDRFRGDRDPAAQRLQHDAVALGEPEQRRQEVVVRVGVELESHADRPEPHSGVLRDAECPADVEVTLRQHRAAAKVHPDRFGHGAQGHAGARHKRLQQHVA